MSKALFYWVWVNAFISAFNAGLYLKSVNAGCAVLSGLIAIIVAIQFSRS